MRKTLSKVWNWLFKKPNKGFTITVVDRGIPNDMNNIVYTFHGDISPEDIAKILVRFATGLEYPVIQKALENAGHQSVGQRMNYVYSSAMELLINDIVNRASAKPRKENGSSTEEGVPIVSPSTGVNLR